MIDFALDLHRVAVPDPEVNACWSPGGDVEVPTMKPAARLDHARTRGAGRRYSKDPIVVEVDRPFLLAVRHARSKAVFFFAQIVRDRGGSEPLPTVDVAVAGKVAHP
ncbi:hypothetical protein GCM10011609_78280 [Lentzea pudingi]|uniref:Uncharacterized protein n=1 Tax=Lentzea pudingi TaxID=1789439 RepID=A0ABQ2IU18_9PSEU|nr:hypothetical protein [Lentzea pudingi]GGN24585.1 hypothetical protein GCM10011609_78280 [Lentzea pudingi]